MFSALKSLELVIQLLSSPIDESSSLVGQPEHDSSVQEIKIAFSFATSSLKSILTVHHALNILLSIN